MLPRIPRTLICDNVRRAGSSSPRRPYYRLELQHGLAPYIAHSFFSAFSERFGLARDAPGLHCFERAESGAPRPRCCEFIVILVPSCMADSLIVACKEIGAARARSLEQP